MLVTCIYINENHLFLELVFRLKDARDTYYEFTLIV